MADQQRLLNGSFGLSSSTRILQWARASYAYEREKLHVHMNFIEHGLRRSHESLSSNPLWRMIRKSDIAREYPAFESDFKVAQEALVYGTRPK